MRRRCCCTSEVTTNCQVFDCLKNWKQSIFVTWEGRWLPPDSDSVSAGREAVVPDLVNGSMLLPYIGPLCTWYAELPATLGPHSIKSFPNPPCPVLTTNIPSFTIYQEVEVILNGFTQVPQFFTRYVVRDDYTYSFSCNGTPYTGTFGPNPLSPAPNFLTARSTNQVEADWIVDCDNRRVTWDHPNTPTLGSIGSGNSCLYLFGGGFCGAKGVIPAGFSKIFSLDKVVIEF